MRDRRLHPGDFDGGDFAQIKAPLADIRAPSGINAACINAEAAGGKQSAGQMVALGHEKRRSDSEDGMSAVQAVVSPKSGVVEGNVLGGNACGNRLFFHGLRLVIIIAAVVTGHQKLLDFAGFVKFNAGGNAVFENAACRAEDNSDRTRRRGSNAFADKRPGALNIGVHQQGGNEENSQQNPETTATAFLFRRGDLLWNAAHDTVFAFSLTFSSIACLEGVFSGRIRTNTLRVIFRRTALEMMEQKSTWQTKVGLAEMLKGGVIMDVINPEQAIIAEEAGAIAVMALERVPADIRRQGGIARMSDPKMIKEIMDVVTIPVMAKARIGHFAEAQILQALGVDFIDESEVLTPADDAFHINKHDFKVPFVCGCRDLGEALRRIGEGAALIRTKGEAGSGNVVEAVRHMRTLLRDIRRIQVLPLEELMAEAKNLGAPYDLVLEVHRTGKLPVPNFSAGGIATPADAALMRQLGAETVFVGSGIFKSGDPKRRAKAIVDANTHYDNPEILAEVSRDIGEPMVGIDISTLPREELMATRGW